MIASMPNTIERDAAPSRAGPHVSAVSLLSLAATPTFAIMALVTATHDGGVSGMMCRTMQNASPLTGMVPMYVLMSAVHSTPWLRLIANWRRKGRSIFRRSGYRFGVENATKPKNLEHVPVQLERNML